MVKRLNGPSRNLSWLSVVLIALDCDHSFLRFHLARLDQIAPDSDRASSRVSDRLLSSNDQPFPHPEAVACCASYYLSPVAVGGRNQLHNINNKK